MKKLLFLLVFCALALSPAGATGWSVLHQTNTTGSTCGTTSLTCAINLTSTGSTDTSLALAWSCGNSRLQNQCVAVTAQTYTGSASAGVCSGTVVDTFSLPLAGQNWLGSQNAAVGYSLTSGGSATCIELTRSTAANDTWDFSFFELNYPVGSIPSLDNVATLQLASPTTLYSGVPLALTGSQDFYLQECACGTALNTVTPTAWAANDSFVGSFGNSYLLNVSNSASVPVWSNNTGASSTGVAAALALSFVSSAAGSTTGVLANGGVKLNGGILFNPPISTVSITSTSPLPNCTVGTPFSFTFAATGGIPPYTWSQPSGTLQPGLSLSSGGVLSGSCTNSSGTDTFGIQACDSESPAACATGSFQQTAQNTPPPTLGVCDSTSSPTCPNPPTPLVTGTFYSYNFNAIGGTAPYTWTIQTGAIPLGQTLTTAGVLSGFPAVNATYTYTVLVTDSTTPTPETATATFTEIVNGATGTPQTAVEPQNWVTLYQLSLIHI